MKDKHAHPHIHCTKKTNSSEQHFCNHGICHPGHCKGAEASAL